MHVCVSTAIQLAGVGQMPHHNASPHQQPLPWHVVLQARPNSIALFVPSEITTHCFYPGLQKDYMVANAIFRMVGCVCGA